jgi:hypothetical protein
MEPKNLIHPRILVTREDNITLATLTTGMPIVGRDGKKYELPFIVRRAPHQAFEGTGWLAVKVRSPFGEESTLLYEAHEDGRVSGMLRLVHPVPRGERVNAKVQEVGA